MLFLENFSVDDLPPAFDELTRLQKLAYVYWRWGNDVKPLIKPENFEFTRSEVQKRLGVDIAIPRTDLLTSRKCWRIPSSISEGKRRKEAPAFRRGSNRDASSIAPIPTPHPPE